MRRLHLSKLSWFLCVVSTIFFVAGRVRLKQSSRSKLKENVNGSGNSAEPKSSTESQSERDTFHRGLNSVEDGTDQKQVFSGCILIRDENHLLAEWLAYHYLVLPLRHLVVAVDPTSLTSPAEILSRWTEDLGDGFDPMTIVLWDDSHYNDGHENDYNDPREDQGNGIHNNRQRRFMRKCAQYHKEMNRTWVVLTDPDEYVTLNKVEDNDPKFMPSRNKPRGVKPKPMPQTYEKYFDNGMNLNKNQLMEQRPDLWQKREEQMAAREISTSGYVDKLIDVANQSPWFESVCITMPRLLFTPRESETDVLSMSNAGKYGLDPMKFRTLRFFHHDSKIRGWWGKVFLDVSRMTMEELEIFPENIHTPYARCGWPVPRYEESVFRIHHYLGTWEEYSFGGDCRRTREIFDELSETSVGTNYDLQQWLGEFINQVGIFRGEYLLKGAGVLPSVDFPTDDCIETT